MRSSFEHSFFAFTPVFSKTILFSVVAHFWVVQWKSSTSDVSWWSPAKRGSLTVSSSSCLGHCLTNIPCFEVVVPANYGLLASECRRSLSSKNLSLTCTDTGINANTWGIFNILPNHNLHHNYHQLHHPNLSPIWSSDSTLDEMPKWRLFERSRDMMLSPSLSSSSSLVMSASIRIWCHRLPFINQIATTHRQNEAHSWLAVVALEVKVAQDE